MLAAFALMPSSLAAQTPGAEQLRSIQQKEFGAQKAAVFGSVVDVMQDLGFSIGSADIATGFIAAESATGNKTSFWDALGGEAASGNIRATAFIETMPDKLTRVRLNFVATKSSSSDLGQNSRKDSAIANPTLYQRMFAKIDEAVFVRTGNQPQRPGDPARAGGSAATVTPIALLGPAVTAATTLSKSAAMTAAKRALEGARYRVIRYDETAGAIATAALPTHVTADAVDCGKMFGISYLRDKRASTEVQYFVDVADHNLTVRLAVDGVYHVNADQTLKCVSRGKMESELIEKVVVR